MISTLIQNKATYAKNKSADQSVTSSVTLTNETDMAVAIGAGETWVVTWQLSTAFAVGTGLLIAVTTPASATQLIQATINPIVTVTGLVPMSNTTTTSGAAITLTVGTVAVALVTVCATVVNSTTAGAITLQFTQTSAGSATPTTLKANSFVTASKV